MKCWIPRPCFPRPFPLRMVLVGVIVASYVVLFVLEAFASVVLEAPSAVFVFEFVSVVRAVVTYIVVVGLGRNPEVDLCDIVLVALAVAASAVVVPAVGIVDVANALVVVVVIVGRVAVAGVAYFVARTVFGVD